MADQITIDRAVVQQALEALKYMHDEKCDYMRRNNLGDPLREDAARLALPAINALTTALAQAEPVQEQDVEDAIEAAYWQFDCRRSGLNEWASAPQSERDAFKAEARKLVRGYFPTRQAQDTKREMLAVADAFIRGKRAAPQQQAEPVQPAIPLENSREARQAIEAMLAEYDHPTNPNNAARAGWRAARLYAAPQQQAEPVQAVAFDPTEALRRQHAEIESLKAERDEDRRREYGYSQQVVDALTNERDALRAERDALLAALENAVDCWQTEGLLTDGHVQAMLAAIAKAKGGGNG